MSKRLVLETEFAQLWFHPEACVVHTELRKFVWGEEYQRILNEGLDLLVREGACRWLSENRNDQVHSRADTEWVMNEFFPRAVRAGFKYWAIVPPDNVLGQMNMERILASASRSGVEGRLFQEPAAALIWLESQSPSAPTRGRAS